MEPFYFKKFNSTHGKKISEILNSLWGFGNNIKHQKTADKFGRAYLYYCLSHSDYAWTLCSGKEIIGITAWRELSKNKIKSSDKISFVKKNIYFLKAFFNALPIFFVKDFTYQVKAWKTFFKECNLQEKELPCTFDSELILFVNDSKVRGQGTGKLMMEFYKEKLKSHHLETFFLHTDTECNYGFYDRAGLKRKLTKVVNEKNGSLQDRWEIFIYANK